MNTSNLIAELTVSNISAGLVLFVLVLYICRLLVKTPEIDKDIIRTKKYGKQRKTVTLNTQTEQTTYTSIRGPMGSPGGNGESGPSGQPGLRGESGTLGIISQEPKQPKNGNMK